MKEPEGNSPGALQLLLTASASKRHSLHLSRLYMSLRKRDSPGSMNGDRIITQATIITTNSLWELLFIRLSRWEKVPGSHGQKALATWDQGMLSGLQQRKARRHHQGSERLITQASCCPHVPKFHPSILVSLPYIGFYLTSFGNIKITVGRNKRSEKHKGAQTYGRDPSRAGKSLALSPASLLWVLGQIVVPLRISSLFANEKPALPLKAWCHCSYITFRTLREELDLILFSGRKH